MTGMRKLTAAQLSTLKRRLMQETKDCPLCGTPFAGVEPKNVVVDHDHGTGQIRGILCRGCNGAEGKVANAAGRWAGLGMDYPKIIAWLERLVQYLQQEPLDVLYPTHMTEAEKKAKAAAKRRKAAEQKARAAVRSKV